MWNPLKNLKTNKNQSDSIIAFKKHVVEVVVTNRLTGNLIEKYQKIVLFHSETMFWYKKTIHYIDSNKFVPYRELSLKDKIIYNLLYSVKETICDEDFKGRTHSVRKKLSNPVSQLKLNKFAESWENDRKLNDDDTVYIDADNVRHITKTKTGEIKITKEVSSSMIENRPELVSEFNSKIPVSQRIDAPIYEESITSIFYDDKSQKIDGFDIRYGVPEENLTQPYTIDFSELQEPEIDINLDDVEFFTDEDLGLENLTVTENESLQILDEIYKEDKP